MKPRNLLSRPQLSGELHAHSHKELGVGLDLGEFLVNKLGHIKILPESIKVEYIENPEPMWVALAVALKEKYQTQLPGAGEQPYLWEVKGEMVPNPFGRRTAISKATLGFNSTPPNVRILKVTSSSRKEQNAKKRIERFKRTPT